MFKYLPHTEQDIKEMLQVIGVKSIDDLFLEIPEELKNLDLNVPNSHSELEIFKHFNNLANKNKVLIPFVGAGSYDHYTPTVIRHLIERQEFLTAYTPYQPEISQGTLQYIFEYQSIITELTGLDVSNASMYDGATATAEAMFMATNSKKRNKILISKTMNPNIISVVETYAKYREFTVDYINEVNGVTDIEDFKNKNSKEYAGVIVQSPNFYGIIEDLSGYREVLDETKGLLIVNSDISTLALLKSPKEFGADIAVGDCQALGVPMSFGGPYIGYLATTSKLMRKMPGRICGVTTDTDGKRAFVLTLQAREQHIRREKANSNICSNQSLLALFVTIYAAVMGKKGLKEVQQNSYNATHYLYDQITALPNFSAVYEQPFFKDCVIETKLDVELINEKLLEKGFLGPLHLGKYDNTKQNQLLFSATEKRTKDEIDLLVNVLEEL
ncbi:putative glycine dehydrogenase (decarboxylating) subunit 1 [Candidatus Izimaplasma bacterium HR1]|jgi:glycine dehydrogenase subunit 1|uniref:aminomethyl-transferring glycine dehydrogenase subunit GcvPA n=1 Tax=Candidatus Izimoplasma sp. HR1 TaxID=1541959 RepID=UPI0004F8B354|nr:putative glycine dehydrogenase (decarboxylating) subunit 1 [Candidatus Izimaplasma bacterium HR1]